MRSTGPEVLNALDYADAGRARRRARDARRRRAVRCVVITGAGERAFAAGADIKEMADATPVTLSVANNFARWERLQRIRMPLIAAVRGFALGGGCELAMACDMIVAGGRRRVRPAGDQDRHHARRRRHAAADARPRQGQGDGDDPDRPQLSASEAEARGLVSRVVAREETLPTAMALAAEIAAMPPLAVRAAKEAVNRAYELSLEAGLEFERRNFFHALRQRRPEGRHARLHGEALAKVERPLAKANPAGMTGSTAVSSPSSAICQASAVADASPSEYAGQVNGVRVRDVVAFCVKALLVAILLFELGALYVNFIDTGKRFSGLDSRYFYDVAHPNREWRDALSRLPVRVPATGHPAPPATEARRRRNRRPGAAVWLGPGHREHRAGDRDCRLPGPARTPGLVGRVDSVARWRATACSCWRRRCSSGASTRCQRC